MKIEKHNSHGLQLSVGMHPEEALALARKLMDTVQRFQESGVNHYINLACLFEDDNDRHEPADFTVMVGDNRYAPARPTYPCGKQAENGGVCNKHEGHEPPCYRW